MTLIEADIPSKITKFATCGGLFTTGPKSYVSFVANIANLSFFYIITFKKGRLLYIHFSDIFPVGWSVGPLLDEANFVQI